MKNNKIKSLVISGGGSKGAWAGGGLQYLVEEQTKDWNNYYGTSTGSLLITLTSLKKMYKLKEAYVDITQKKIFSINPFTKRGNINILNAIKRLFQRKTSLGESGGLKKIILKMFTKDEFLETISLGKKLYACVVNYTIGKVQFKSNQNVSYNEYVNYTWASTSVPIFTDIVQVNGSDYLDGGVMEHVPLQRAINDGADEVDIFILRPEKYEDEKWTPKNMFEVLTRTIELMEREISHSDVLIGKLEAQKKNVKLNFYYTPYLLTKNSLMFNREDMERWWKEGYEYVRDNGPTKCVMLSKNGEIKEII